MFSFVSTLPFVNDLSSPFVGAGSLGTWNLLPVGFGSSCQQSAVALCGGAKLIVLPDRAL